MVADLKSFEAAVNKVKALPNQNQFDAHDTLTYNIGMNAFANFRPIYFHYLVLSIFLNFNLFRFK